MKYFANPEVTGGESTFLSTMINLILHLSKLTGNYPYIYGGLGFLRSSFNDITVGTTTYQVDSETAFALTIGVVSTHQFQKESIFLLKEVLLPGLQRRAENITIKHLA